MDGVVRRGSRLLQFRSYGPTNASRTVLWNHGAPSCRLEPGVFGLNVRSNELDLRIVAVDRPGLGGSSASTISPCTSRERFGEWAEDCRAVLDEVGCESCSTIGFSNGGPFALALGAFLPERIRRVGLICPAPPPGCRSSYGQFEAAFLGSIPRRVLGSSVILGAKAFRFAAAVAPRTATGLLTIGESQETVRSSAAEAAPLVRLLGLNPPSRCRVIRS